MIEFDQVVRTYGPKTAVDRLSLRVERGELFAFLGPNGAGKTTSIKLLVGLLNPTAGRVLVCDREVSRDHRQTSHRLGYVPDEPYLYDKLTGREFLEFIVDMYGYDRKLGAQRMAREIAYFELAEFIDDLTETYSHGMKQRVVFASAMLHDPEVLVLDEPMVGLDPRSSKLVKDLLRSRAAEGVTVFMSTHTLSLAEEIADRIGIVNQGQLQFVGTVAELRSRLSQETTSLEDLFLELTSTRPPG